MPLILPVPGPSEGGDDWPKYLQNVQDILKSLCEKFVAFIATIGATIPGLWQKGVEHFKEIPWYFIAKYPANYIATFMAPGLAGGLLVAFGLVPELLFIVAFLPFVLLSFVFCIVLNCVGFGSGGVRAGSMAAGYQSVNYGGTVPQGSLFSQGQSIGAVGLGGLSFTSALFWPRVVIVIVGVLIIVSNAL